MCAFVRYDSRIYESMKVWEYEGRTLWYYDPMILWDSATMMLWFYETIILWYSETMILCVQTILYVVLFCVCVCIWSTLVFSCGCGLFWEVIILWILEIILFYGFNWRWSGDVSGGVVKNRSSRYVAFHLAYIEWNVQCHLFIFFQANYSQFGWHLCGSILPWQTTVRELESLLYLRSFFTVCHSSFWFVTILPVYCFCRPVSIFTW